MAASQSSQPLQTFLLCKIIGPKHFVTPTENKLRQHASCCLMGLNNLIVLSSSASPVLMGMSALLQCVMSSIKSHQGVSQRHFFHGHESIVVSPPLV